MTHLGKRFRLSETSDDENEHGEDDQFPDEYSVPGKRLRSNDSITSSGSEDEDHGLGIIDDDDDASNDNDNDNDNIDSGISTAESLSVVSNNDKSSFANKYLEKFGHVKGKGLGKYQQGISRPVEAFKQKGRRGLGHEVTGLEEAATKFDPTEEEVSVEENVLWLNNDYRRSLTVHELKPWIKMGTRKETIDDEHEFCDPHILEQVLGAKTIFDKLGDDDMRKARTRCNPFELIRGAFFLNRAAMKMANMDKVFDFMFTRPKDTNGADVIGDSDLLYFADVCAGPGGFSEYVLYRKQWRAKGFGFTLKNDNDFRLSEFYAAPCESFEPHYGKRDDGDIFIPDNITSFKEFVLRNTDHQGVHFMMADGGFSVEGKENIQEILSKQLYLCQCLVALLIVRPNGHFVVKLFDLFTPFSIGLIYLMYRSFHQISIHKPNTSRPANSERYLVCKYKREDSCDISSYLYNVNNILHTMGNDIEEDILEIVPMEILKEDKDFFEYIVNSNNSLGRRQIAGLTKIAAYCDDPALEEPRQQELRKQCLEYWEIEDRPRKAPPKVNPDEKVTELCKNNSQSYMGHQAEEVRPGTLSENFPSIFDWHCVLLGSPKDSSNTCGFYLGMGRKKVYRFMNHKWSAVPEMPCELTPNTLVYGEIVQESSKDGRGQVRNNSFHIIDGLFLGGEDIRSKHITERQKMCSLFVKSIRKSTDSIRVKKLIELDQVENEIGELRERILKNLQPCLGFSLENEHFFKPTGMLFLKGTKEPWMRALSSSTGYKYYHAPNRTSKYDRERPKDAILDFESGFEKRLIWWWEDGVKLQEGQRCQIDPNKLQAYELTKFVRAKTVTKRIK